MRSEGWENESDLSGHTFLLEKQAYLIILLSDASPEWPGINHHGFELTKTTLVDAAEMGIPQAGRRER